MTMPTVPAMPTMAEPGSARQSAREEELLRRVLSSFDACPDLRRKQVMQALVRHLHAFLREVRLTEQEWWTAIGFLTDAGHITDDRRQEFILLSDVLGASMQMVTINDTGRVDGPTGPNGSTEPTEPTEATIFGPFFVEGAPRVELGGDIAGVAHGTPCWVEGTVRDTGGAPVPGARIDVWESDADGHYDVQYDDGRVAGRAHLLADEAGAYRFWGVVPAPYPIPDDGPVGALLRACGRSPMRAAHLHFMVTATDHRRLVTHIFPSDDPLLDRDAVFGVRHSLVKMFESQPAGAPTPDGRDIGGRSWSRVRFDIVLAPAGDVA